MSDVPDPKELNDELLRLITANKARLAKLQKTIADLQQRTETTGETAHFWEKSPDREPSLAEQGKNGS